MQISRAIAAAFAMIALTGAALAGAKTTAMNDMGSMNDMSSMKGMSSAARTVHVTMNAQNGSKEHGTATLMQSGKNILVKISLANGTSFAQPAHIHQGTCAHLNPVPKYPLANVLHGKSTTTLKNLSLNSLLGGKYAVNVHESAQKISTYVSCGDIK